MEEVDAVILATGFELNLPFLSVDIRNTVDLDAQHIDLYKFTFHPNLPGLAFLGLWEQTGPYPPILELQARWIAYVWSGLLPALSGETMREGIADVSSRSRRSTVEIGEQIGAHVCAGSGRSNLIYADGRS